MGNVSLIFFYIINCVTPTDPSGKETHLYELYTRLYSLLMLFQVAKSRREKMVVVSISFSSLIFFSLPSIFSSPTHLLPEFFPSLLFLPYLFSFHCKLSSLVLPPFLLYFRGLLDTSTL
jgi:hypothetical protein